MCSPQRSALLDPMYQGHQFRWGNLAGRSRTNPGEHVSLKSVEYLIGVVFGPVWRVFADSLPRHGFEAIRVPTRCLRRLRACAALMPAPKLLAQFISPVAHVL